jgi:hypothetical protein
VFYLHKLYSVKLNPDNSDKDESLSVKTIRSALRKIHDEKCSKPMKYVSNFLKPVYFSVIRKEIGTTSLSHEAKYRQDKQFRDHLLSWEQLLTTYLQYIWWFSHQTRVKFELLFKNKPEEGDLPGLLLLIMFAGLAAGKEEYFKSQIIQHQYLSLKRN